MNCGTYWSGVHSTDAYNHLVFLGKCGARYWSVIKRKNEDDMYVIPVSYIFDSIINLNKSNICYKTDLIYKIKFICII